MVRFTIPVVWLGLLGCGDGLDPSKLIPGAQRARGCADATVAACGAARSLATSVCRSGEWTIAAPAAARYAELAIAGAGARSAATLDWDVRDGKSDLAGFLVAPPPSVAGATGRRADERALGVASLLAGAGHLRSVALVSSGYLVDGDVAGVVLEARQAGTTALYAARNPLFALLTALDLDQLRDLPGAPLESSDAFVVSFGLATRAGAPVVAGSVATRSSFESRLGKARIAALDLASGSALAPPSAAPPRARCRSARIPATASGLPLKADLLWVVDGADSLASRRVALHQGAAALWSRGRAVGLDLRMAVVDMAQGGVAGAIGACRPKGCAGPFFGADDAGLGCFQQCLLTPGSGSGSSAPADARRGVDSARRALLSMLPRATGGDALRVRAGAQVAVVFVSDGEDAALAELLGGAVPDHPSPALELQIDAYLAPLRELLLGRAAPAELPAGARADELAGTAAYALVPHPLVDNPGAQCGRRAGRAYRELAALSGGFFGHLCLEDPALFLELLIEAVAARAGGASQLRLEGQPISSSLGVALGGASLFRSRKVGFDYGRGGNSLVLVELAASLQGRVAEIDAAYLGW